MLFIFREPEQLGSENECFASPTPVRRSTRTRKSNMNSTSTSLANTKRNQEELLQDSDMASEDDFVFSKVTDDASRSSAKNRYVNFIHFHKFFCFFGTIVKYLIRKLINE